MFLEICLFLSLLVGYYIFLDRKPKGMPPGPWEIPFIGNRPILSTGHVSRLVKYGGICTVRLGFRTVVIMDYKIAKEAMASPDLADRPAFFSDFSLDEKKKGGLVGSNGPQWVHERRFALRNLRNLGMGKSNLETAINQEAQALVDDLKMYKEEAVVFPGCLKTVPLNVIWQMVAGKRYDLRSEEVSALTKLNDDFRNNTSIWMFLPFFFPKFFKMIPKSITDKIFGVNIFDQLISKTKSIVNPVIEEHEEGMKSGKDENKDDFIHEYLLEMKKCEDDEDPIAYRGSLLQIVSDLFGAGSDTVYNQLRWTVFLLAKYPDIAKQLQREIDEHVPRNQLVSLDDKPNLPLVEAFMTECLRYGSFVVLNVQRAAARDTTIGGYHVPKGMSVVVCNSHIHFDPKYWTNPDDFDPTRFITAEGKFQAPKEGFFAFGSGRRVCLGETLARMEYFLFTAAIVQNFNILVPQGGSLVDGCVDKMGARTPHDQPFVFQCRQ